MIWKDARTSVEYLYVGQMKFESAFSFISNCRGNSDDVTLLQPVSSDFTNQRFISVDFMLTMCLLW